MYYINKEIFKMGGEQFLDKLYRELHMSDAVMHSAGAEKSKLKKLENIWRDWKGLM